MGEWKKILGIKLINLDFIWWGSIKFIRFNSINSMASEYIWKSNVPNCHEIRLDSFLEIFTWVSGSRDGGLVRWGMS